MATGKLIVTTAENWKGQHEVPMGSNTGTFVIACQHSTFLGGTGWPWCAAFVCHVAAKAGVPLAYNGAGAHDLANHHTATKKTFVEAQPGDVVDFNIGSGHTGILVSKEGNSVTTIDGNWADAVTQHVTPVYQVRGFWRIPGVSGQAAPAPRKPPAWVVTTGASGHKKVFRRKKGLIHYLQTHVFPNGITIHRPKN
jgi:hypothetical protein